MFLVELWDTKRERFKMLNFHLKPVMQSSKSFIKDSGDFIRKAKFIQSILSNVIFVTADMVGLYPSIPEDSGLQDTINPL